MNGIRSAGLLAAMASIAAGVILAPAALGFAGYQAGPYTGATEQDEEIRFRAGEWQMKRLNAVAYADCKNGRRQRIEVDDGRTMIDDSRFELELTGPSDLEVTVTGRIQGDDATGRLEASVRPSGGLCTADLRWRAERIERAASRR